MAVITPVSALRSYAAIAIVLLFLLAGCGSYRIYSGSVQYDASEYNNIIKSSELNAYLSSRDTLRFFLRYPPGFEDMAVERQTLWNEISGQIEKELIRKGHIVKDRILIETLLNKGALMGQSFRKALDTDIIIDLINVDFDLPNPTYDFVIKEKKIRSNFNNWSDLTYVDCRMAKLECRISLAERGNIGGIFQFYVSGCDEANNFYIKVYENTDGTLNPEREAYVGWNVSRVDYKTLTHSYNLNQASRNKAIERLVSALLTTLTTEKSVAE